MPWGQPAVWTYRKPNGEVYTGPIRPPTGWKDQGYTEVRVLKPASDEAALHKRARSSR
jgi:hypothetical protein